MIVDFNYIVKFLLNLVFLSIPQAVVMILLALLLLKEFDYFKKENFKKTLLDVLMIAGIQIAFFTNYLFYFTNINIILRLFLNTVIVFAFINFLIKSTIKESLWKNHLNTYSQWGSLGEVSFKNNYINDEFRIETDRYTFTVRDSIPNVKYKNTKEVYLVSVFLISTLIIIETFTGAWLQYIFNFDIKSIGNSIISNILLSYPSIMFLVSIIYLGYIYINTKTNKIVLFEVWESDKDFRLKTYIQSIIFFVFFVLVYIFLLSNSLLTKLNNEQSLIIILGVSIIFLLQSIMYIKTYIKAVNREK